MATWVIDGQVTDSGYLERPRELEAMHPTRQGESKPVSQADEYIRRAEEAEAKANASNNPTAQQSYMATAANWRRLAAFVDPEWKRR